MDPQIFESCCINDGVLLFHLTTLPLAKPLNLGIRLFSERREEGFLALLITLRT